MSDPETTISDTPERPRFRAFAAVTPTGVAVPISYAHTTTAAWDRLREAIGVEATDALHEKGWRVREFDCQMWDEPPNQGTTRGSTE
jgi:hypothetical protein